MQPISKSSSGGSIVFPSGDSGPKNAMDTGAASAEVRDRKSKPGQLVSPCTPATRSPDDAPGKSLGAYQVRVAPAQGQGSQPLAPAPSTPAETLRGAHTRAAASLQAFIDIEGNSLPSADRSLFVEFLAHGEFGLAYDVAVGLLAEGWTWSAASVGHLKVAARAMGIEYPRQAH